MAGGGIAAAAAGLVRPTAVALGAACAWGAIVAIRSGGSWRALVAPAVAPWGALLYLGYVWIHTGEAFGFFEVQDRGWGNRVDIGLTNIRAVLRHVGDARLTFFVAMLAAVVGGLGIGLWLLVRWRAPGVIVVYVSIVMGLAVLASNPVLDTSVPARRVPAVDPPRQTALGSMDGRDRCDVRHAHGRTLLRDRAESEPPALIHTRLRYRWLTRIRRRSSRP